MSENVHCMLWVLTFFGLYLYYMQHCRSTDTATLFEEENILDKYVSLTNDP